MTTVLIEVGDGQTAPMTPPAELGSAFAAFIATTLAFDDDQLTTVHALYCATTAVYDEAADRVNTALSDAGLDWSCQFGQPGSDAEAMPYIDTLAGQVSPGAAAVAGAVLARDLRLVTEADFTTVTSWWAGAGFPIPEPGPTAGFAADDSDVQRQHRKLASYRFHTPGWPTSVVDAAADRPPLDLPPGWKRPTDAEHAEFLRWLKVLQPMRYWGDGDYMNPRFEQLHGRQQAIAVRRLEEGAAAVYLKAEDIPADALYLVDIRGNLQVRFQEGGNRWWQAHHDVYSAASSRDPWTPVVRATGRLLENRGPLCTPPAGFMTDEDEARLQALVADTAVTDGR